MKSDSTPDYIKITNQEIVSFYQLNSHIDFESVNLLLIDILQQNKGTLYSTTNNQIESAISLYPYQEDQKCKELDTFVNNMREGVRKLIQSISSKYIVIKSEYIREFKSASLENDPRELITNANKKFFEQTCSLFSVIFQQRIFNIAE
jgi:Zn-dependent M32 family carboxypeptidase